MECRTTSGEGAWNSQQLYACVYAAEFSAQALLRLRTDWQTEAVVVMDGSAPQEWVCSMNRLAERKGAVVGMTRLEAEGVRDCGCSSDRSKAKLRHERYFWNVPRSFLLGLRDAGEFDAARKRGRWARTRELRARWCLTLQAQSGCLGRHSGWRELREELAEAGFRVSVAVSANYEAARMKSAGIHGIAVIPEGAEAETLTKMPIAALGLDEERTATLMLWGINTLGELAALPEAELVARLGPEARRWHALARGAGDHAFVPIERAFNLRRVLRV